MRRSITALTIVALTGCAAAPPNTPGAGSGDTYTTFIDMQGLDSTRYANDLAGCRSYAQQIDPGKQAMAGMIGGMFIGALIGGAIGGNRYNAERGALAGGGAGLGGAAGRAVVKQETVIANCMAGRGYRVLEGATIATNTSAPSPYVTSMAPAAAPMGYVPTQAAQPQVQAQIVGRDSGAVERLALQQMCTNQPKANRIASGPGYDTYSVACTNGDVMTIRCEFGNCRALR